MRRGDGASLFPEEFEARGRNIENYRVPGGESFADCSRRALAGWEAMLRDKHERIAVADHAGINRLLLCSLLGMPIANLFRIGQDYGCANIVRQNGERTCGTLINGDPTDLRERLSSRQHFSRFHTVWAAS